MQRLSIRCNYISVLQIIGACSLLSAVGCAGPKLLSIHNSGSVMLQVIPAGQHVAVARAKEDSALYRSQTQQLHAALTKKLGANSKFSAVPSGDPSVDSTLNVNIVDVRRVGWWRRALAGVRGQKSSVSAQGQLVANDGSVLATIRESRAGVGGLFGDGGLLACGENSMIKVLTHWLAEDIVAALQKKPKNGAQSE